MATGTPSRTVGYLSVHPSVDFARSFLARTEQVTDSVHSAPACLALSSTEMDGGIGLASARAATASHSLWVTGWTLTMIEVFGVFGVLGGWVVPVFFVAVDW